MKWVFYFTHIFYFTLLFSESLLAETLRLKAHYNIRSSPDFLSSSNLVGSLKAGSVIEVLEKKRLPSGAYGLRINIVTSNGDSRRIASEQKWIYKLNEAHYADVSDSVERPSTPKPKTNIFRKIKKKIETEAQSEAVCEECLKKPTAMATPQNHRDLGSISQSVEKSNNEISEPSSVGDSLHDQVRNYSNSKEVKSTIGFALKHFARTRGLGKCYKAVKLALTASPSGRGHGLVPARFDDEAAINAQVTLKEKFGFINLLKEPDFKNEIKSAADAPKGSVLVYSSGKRCKRSSIADCGHTEIKTDKGYVSDFFSRTPMSDDPDYVLVGVMVKPMSNGKR